jgi:hypothetical protein
MTDLPAGARLLASEINAALPIYMRASSDTTKTSSTALGDATGMTLELEASSTYVMDGYLAYTAGATGDLKVAWTVPTGTTGHWCLYGLYARRITAFGDANTQSIGGSDSLSGSLAALPRLYVVTSTTAGDITMRFAQNTSSGTSTIIRIGTWVRAVKVA